MDKPRIRKAHGPEYGIQRDIVKFLRARGWHCERLIGMAWQSGLTDLLIFHRQYGIRLLEIKQEDHYRFTKAQKTKFPVLMNFGGGIWIMTEATEVQYERLFKPPNLWDYLDPNECLPYEEYIDEYLKEIEDESRKI
jgi:hypothetical protein